MPLPQAPINTAPGFGERLLQSGTFSQAGNMITQGILQGKAMADWKRFIQSGEVGSKALYNKVVTEMPELRGTIPEPYFDPNKPNEYILSIAKATSDYKQRKGMATGIRDYKTAMQNREALQAQPAQLEQGGTMPQGDAGPQQPAQRNFLQSVPQQDIGATAELLASGAESGNLRDMLEVTKELTSALSESAKAQTETVKTLTGAVTNAAGATPYRPSFGDVNMENIMAGKFGFTEERQLKPQLVQRPTGSSGEDITLKNQQLLFKTQQEEANITKDMADWSKNSQTMKDNIITLRGMWELQKSLYQSLGAQPDFIQAQGMQKYLNAKQKNPSIADMLYPEFAPAAGSVVAPLPGARGPGADLSKFAPK
jgi:hypothetical protein